MAEERNFSFVYDYDLSGITHDSDELFAGTVNFTYDANEYFEDTERDEKRVPVQFANGAVDGELPELAGLQAAVAAFLQDYTEARTRAVQAEAERVAAAELKANHVVTSFAIVEGSADFAENTARYTVSFHGADVDDAVVTVKFKEDGTLADVNPVTLLAGVESIAVTTITEYLVNDQLAAAFRPIQEAKFTVTGFEPAQENAASADDSTVKGQLIFANGSRAAATLTFNEAGNAVERIAGLPEEFNAVADVIKDTTGPAFFRVEANVENAYKPLKDAREEARIAKLAIDTVIFEAADAVASTNLTKSEVRLVLTDGHLKGHRLTVPYVYTPAPEGDADAKPIITFDNWTPDVEITGDDAARIKAEIDKVLKAQAPGEEPEVPGLRPEDPVAVQGDDRDGAKQQAFEAATVALAEWQSKKDAHDEWQAKTNLFNKLAEVRTHIGVAYAGRVESMTLVADGFTARADVKVNIKLANKDDAEEYTLEFNDDYTAVVSVKDHQGEHVDPAIAKNVQDFYAALPAGSKIRRDIRAEAMAIRGLKLKDNSLDVEINGAKRTAILLVNHRHDGDFELTVELDKNCKKITGIVGDAHGLTVKALQAEFNDAPAKAKLQAAYNNSAIKLTLKGEFPAMSEGGKVREPVEGEEANMSLVQFEVEAGSGKKNTAFAEYAPNGDVTQQYVLREHMYLVINREEANPAGVKQIDKVKAKLEADNKAVKSVKSIAFGKDTTVTLEGDGRITVENAVVKTSKAEGKVNFKMSDQYVIDSDTITADDTALFEANVDEVTKASIAELARVDRAGKETVHVPFFDKVAACVAKQRLIANSDVEEEDFTIGEKAYGAAFRVKLQDDEDAEAQTYMVTKSTPAQVWLEGGTADSPTFTPIERNRANAKVFADLSTVVDGKPENPALEDDAKHMRDDLRETAHYLSIGNKYNIVGKRAQVDAAEQIVKTSKTPWESVKNVFRHPLYYTANFVRGLVGAVVGAAISAVVQPFATAAREASRLRMRLVAVRKHAIAAKHGAFFDAKTNEYYVMKGEGDDAARENQTNEELHASALADSYKGKLWFRALRATFWDIPKGALVAIASTVNMLVRIALAPVEGIFYAVKDAIESNTSANLLAGNKRGIVRALTMTFDRVNVLDRRGMKAEAEEHRTEAGFDPSKYNPQMVRQSAASKLSLVGAMNEPVQNDKFFGKDLFLTLPLVLAGVVGLSAAALLLLVPLLPAGIPFVSAAATWFSSVALPAITGTWIAGFAPLGFVAGLAAPLQAAVLAGVTWAATYVAEVTMFAFAALTKLAGLALNAINPLNADRADKTHFAAEATAAKADRKGAKATLARCRADALAQIPAEGDEETEDARLVRLEKLVDSFGDKLTPEQEAQQKAWNAFAKARGDADHAKHVRVTMKAAETNRDTHTPAAELSAGAAKVGKTVADALVEPRARAELRTAWNLFKASMRTWWNTPKALRAEQKAKLKEAADAKKADPKAEVKLGRVEDSVITTAAQGDSKDALAALMVAAKDGDPAEFSIAKPDFTAAQDAYAQSFVSDSLLGGLARTAAAVLRTAAGSEEDMTAAHENLQAAATSVV